MEILKTPVAQFENIKDFPYQENHVDYNGMQMHYIDEGRGETILALHGEPSWSYLYRKFVPELKNYRFIAPDLIGFGKSDKVVNWKHYSYDFHFKSIKNLIDKLALKDITLVVQDWGGLLGLGVLAEYPDLFKQVVVLNTFLPIGKPLNTFFKAWVAYAKYHPSLPIGRVMQMGSHQKLSKEVIAAYEAPFPGKKYKGGAKAFPTLVPGNPKSGGVQQMKKAREVLSKWQKPALVMFSDKDKLMSGLENFFYELIPTSKAQEKIIIKGAGHFLQEEKGEEIARNIDKFMRGELLVK